MSLNPEQLRAEAEKVDRLVQRHARHRVIGAEAGDYVPLPLTVNTQKLAEKDRQTLAELFRKQAEFYQDVAELLNHKRS